MIPVEARERGRFQPYLDEVDDRISGCVVNVQPPQLREAMAHALGGGKRIRPLIAMLICDSVGGDVHEASPVAAAIELLHTSSLIHDDIMDGADLRRGVPTVHMQWDVPTAILAGDAMIALAFRTLHRSVAVRRARIFEIFSEAFVHVSEGQGYDLCLSGQGFVSTEMHRMTVEKKTAKMIEAAAQIGALVGTDNEAIVLAAERFGYHLGMAFQAHDDLLDVVGQAHVMGKPVGIDARNGRQTYLTLAYSVAETSREQDLGSLENARRVVLDHTNAASRLLDTLPAHSSRELLRSIALSLTERTW